MARIITILAMLLLMACSPIPLIQDPHCDSEVSISTSIKRTRAGAGDGLDRKREKFVVEDVTPLFVTIGIAKRFEFSGSVAPYFIYGLLYYSNIKVKLLDIGRSDFRNLAAALFVGGSGYNGEHEDKLHVYGGLSLGTTAHLGATELGFVAQASYSREDENDLEIPDRYRIYWIQPAFGIVCKPGKKRFFQLSTGINYSYARKSEIVLSDFSHTPIQSRYLNTIKGGLCFVGEIRFNFSLENISSIMGNLPLLP
jgi:hypothetical protein